MPATTLGATDWRILGRLRGDARLTNVELAKQAKRPRAATKRKRR
jgi:DNA-binding Lrp family transcriptional regulator